MLCPNCKRYNVSTVEVCGACGTALPAQETHSRPIEYNPPVEAQPASAAPLKKTGVPLILLLSLLTMGIYYPVWFITQLESLNAMNSTVKLKKGAFITVIILFALSVVAAFASIGLEGKADAARALDLMSRFLNIAGGIILLVESFHVKRILSEHFNTKLSGAATFFFNVLYLQYKINRL
ncbi:MAG: zinc ribbon domain-containing protein [Deltaproteobacteria bacterium]|nr:zinc ribbon domain-containing protein [Deltaproteobacteria bacterium]